jgi:hypothetical protein
MVRRLNEWYHTFPYIHHSELFSRFEQGVILSSDDLVKNSLCFLPYYGLTYAFSHELCEFSAHRGNFVLVILRPFTWTF